MINLSFYNVLWNIDIKLEAIDNNIYCQLTNNIKNV